MPPSPIRPMNSPCPIHSGHGGPKVEIARPTAIISEPQITVQRVPTLSPMRPIRMPPAPLPSQASAEASAGIEREPFTSAAMSLSATAVIQAAPNAIAMMTSATKATTQDALVSTEAEIDCDINEKPGWPVPITDRNGFDHPHRCGSALMAALLITLRQTARNAVRLKFPSPRAARNEIDPRALRCKVLLSFSYFASCRHRLYDYARADSLKVLRSTKVTNGTSPGQPRRQIRSDPKPRLRDRLSGADPRLPDAEGA